MLIRIPQWDLRQLIKLSSDISLIQTLPSETLFSLLVNMSHACFWHHSTRRLIRLAQPNPQRIDSQGVFWTCEGASPAHVSRESMCTRSLARHFWSPYLQTHWEAPSRERKEKERSADRPGSGGGNKPRPFDGGAERPVNETMVRPADRSTPGQTAPTAA
jgi:hypothetical protein